MSFLSHANKTFIHMNDFALSLDLKRKLRATRKWAIGLTRGNAHVLPVGEGRGSREVGWGGVSHIKMTQENGIPFLASGLALALRFGSSVHTCVCLRLRIRRSYTSL